MGDFNEEIHLTIDIRVAEDVDILVVVAVVAAAAVACEHSYQDMFHNVAEEVVGNFDNCKQLKNEEKNYKNYFWIKRIVQINTSWIRQCCVWIETLWHWRRHICRVRCS